MNMKSFYCIDQSAIHSVKLCNSVCHELDIRLLLLALKLKLESLAPFLDG